MREAGSISVSVRSVPSVKELMRILLDGLRTELDMAGECVVIEISVIRRCSVEGADSR